MVRSEDETHAPQTAAQEDGPQGASSGRPRVPAPPVELLERFRMGDAAAFEVVMRQHDGLVRGVAARWFKSAFEREELVQDTWVHVFEKRASVDAQRNQQFAGWLVTVAQRRCIDVLRRQGSLQGMESRVAALPPEPLPDAHDVVEDRQVLQAVEAFKALLKPRFREFFELHFVQGLPYAEIEARVGLGPLRCRYMKKVIALRARNNRALMTALGRHRAREGSHAPAR
jgi:RNA polymerase sigma-70 factor (ECF subfamily)